MSTIINLFQAFGLSASAGLNAYIPLLIVSLAARYTDAFELSGPYKVLESPWIIGTLVVLVIVEALADNYAEVMGTMHAAQAADEHRYNTRYASFN